MKTLRILTVLAVLLLTAYPAVELTRCIIKYMILTDIFRNQPLDVYYMELVLIVAFYLAMPVVLWVSLGLMGRMGKAADRQGGSEL